METPKESLFKRPWVQSLLGVVIIILASVGLLSYKAISSRISIDKSVVSAPIISITSQTGGILEEVYVKVGDKVENGQPLARVSAEVLSAKISGLVIEVNNTPGQAFSAGQAIVKMVDPREFKVVGTVKENSGLSDIKVGDPVSFTVDAFAGKTYVGIVDSISPTARETGVVFNISDKRETKEFDVSVRYDILANPDFKNGMSAKMKIYKL